MIACDGEGEPNRPSNGPFPLVTIVETEIIARHFGFFSIPQEPLRLPTLS